MELVELHELNNIEIRLLKNLHLADVDILQGEGASSSLLHSLPYRLRNELLEDFTQVALGDLGSDDVTILARMART